MMRGPLNIKGSLSIGAGVGRGLFLTHPDPKFTAAGLRTIRRWTKDEPYVLESRSIVKMIEVRIIKYLSILLYSIMNQTSVS